MSTICIKKYKVAGVTLGGLAGDKQLVSMTNAFCTQDRDSSYTN